MKKEKIKEILLKESYFILNKKIIKKLGVEMTYLLANFIEASDTISNDEGWFFQTYRTVEDLTGFKRKKQENYIDELIKLQIILKRNIGIPRRRYFKINVEKLREILYFDLEEENLESMVELEREEEIKTIELEKEEEEIKLTEYVESKEISDEKITQESLLEKISKKDELLKKFQLEKDKMRDIEEISKERNIEVKKAVSEEEKEKITSEEISQEFIEDSEKLKEKLLKAEEKESKKIEEKEKTIIEEISQEFIEDSEKLKEKLLKAEEVGIKKMEEKEKTITGEISQEFIEDSEKLKEKLLKTEEIESKKIEEKIDKEILQKEEMILEEKKNLNKEEILHNSMYQRNDKECTQETNSMYKRDNIVCSKDTDSLYKKSIQDCSNCTDSLYIENKRVCSQGTNSIVQNVQTYKEININNKDKEINIKIDRSERAIEDKKEYSAKASSIDQNFKNNIFSLKEIIANSTNISMNIVDNSIYNILPTLRKYDLKLLISKIKESDFLMGKLESKPNVANFTRKNMIDRIMADEYKNKDYSKMEERVDYGKKEREILPETKELYRMLGLS